MSRAAVGEPVTVRAAVERLSGMAAWPARLRPPLCLATSAGIELVYRAERLGEAAYLLSDAATVRCLRPGRDRALTVALEGALREQARRLPAEERARVRWLREVLRFLEDGGPPPTDAEWGAPWRAGRQACASEAPPALPGDAWPELVAAAGVLALARGDLAGALAAADRTDGAATAGRALLLALAGRGAEASAALAEPRGPTSPAVERAWAQAAIAIGRWDAAFRAWRAAVDPRRGDDLLACARLAVQAGEPTWAATAARRALALEIEPAQRGEALDLLVVGGAGDEVPAVVDALAGEAGPALFARAAEACLWMDRHDDAERWAARAEADADDELSRRLTRLRGGVAIRRGELERGIAILRPVLEAWPQDRETTIWLGEAQLRLGRRDEGRAILERYDKYVTGEHPLAKLLHGITRLEDEYRLIEREGGIGSTLYIYRNIAGDVLGERPWLERPMDLEADRALLWSAVDAFGGNRSNTLTLLRDGRLEPTRHIVDPRVRVVEAQHRVLSAGPADAIARLEAEQRARPDVPYPRTYAAEIELWRGDYARATEAFRAVWEETGTRWGYVGLGAALVMRGRSEEGIAVLDEGVGRFAGAIPGEATPAYRGEALFALGRLDEAREELERAVSLRPTRLGAWAVLARVRRALGDDAGADEAAATFERAAPVLIWEAHRSLGLPPSVTADRAHGDAVLARSLELMKGNRGSYVLTFFDREGRWRAMETTGAIERLVELAGRMATDACVSSLEALLARRA